MPSDPQLPDQYVRAIYRLKALGLCLMFIVYSFIEAFVSPFGEWLAISCAIIAAAVPALAVIAWRAEIPRRLLRVSLYVDAAALTTGIHLGGGIDNVSMPLLYTVVIGFTGLLLTRTDTVAVTVFSVVLYDAMVLAEYTGVLTHLVPYSRAPLRQLSTAIPVNIFLFLFSWLVSYTVERIRAMYRRMEETRQEAVQTLSHDLKNPLAVIHGYIGLLAEAEGQEREAYSRGIERAAQQAIDLVSNVLDAAAFEGRPVMPQLVPTQLNDIVRGTVRRYESAARAERISLTADLDPALRVVEVDPQLITRAVDNLLSNAIKYGGAGGTVRVSTALSDDAALIRVSDSGPGIPDAEQPLLFRRYSRGSSARGVEGSGLGLYIVRRIAEIHRGSVSVASEPGRGCTFTLHIPFVFGSC